MKLLPSKYNDSRFVDSLVQPDEQIVEVTESQLSRSFTKQTMSAILGSQLSLLLEQLNQEPDTNLKKSKTTCKTEMKRSNTANLDATKGKDHPTISMTNRSIEKLSMILRDEEKQGKDPEIENRSVSPASSSNDSISAAAKSSSRKASSNRSKSSRAKDKKDKRSRSSSARSKHSSQLQLELEKVVEEMSNESVSVKKKLTGVLMEMIKANNSHNDRKL